MTADSLIEKTEKEKRRQAENLKLFDAGIWLGKAKEFPLAPTLTAGDLPSVYGKYFLTGGLVSHWSGAVLSAQEGNAVLQDAEASLPGNTYTVWTALPLLPKEQGPLPGFGPPEGKMRGVRIFPKTHRYELSPWVLGGLCSWCTEYQVPLFIWHVEADWNGLFSLASEYPGVPIIVESQWQKILYHNRNVYNLLRSCPNVFLEISNFAGQDFLSHAVTVFGAERFLFGSFLPVSDPFVPLGMLLDAEIEESQRRAVAEGNAVKLISEVVL